MKNILQDIRDFFVSLKLTVALLVFGMVLVFAATLDQTNLGVWGIQQKWFHTFVVFQDIRGVMLPIYPGGYLIGGLLLINLVAAHVDRFKFIWRKAGIFLTHAGLILLLVGELLSGLWQEDFNMRLSNGDTKNYAESYRFNELAITDTTNPKFDDVVTIPDAMLARHAAVQHPKLPFRVVTRAYYPNSFIQARAADCAIARHRRNRPQRRCRAAARHLQAGRDQHAHRLRRTQVRPMCRPAPSSFPPGWSGPQHFDYAGRSWTITLRPRRIYMPFSITLLKFSHDNYAGTDIPKNFSSRVRVTTSDGRNDREALIYMNSPLRYGGLRFYQGVFENNDRTTILQVVRNPSWILPYVACALMALGLIGQFGIHLFGFVQKVAPKNRSRPSREIPLPRVRGPVCADRGGLHASRPAKLRRLRHRRLLAACPRWSTAVSSRSTPSRAPRFSSCRDASASPRPAAACFRPTSGCSTCSSGPRSPTRTRPL